MKSVSKRFRSVSIEITLGLRDATQNKFKKIEKVGFNDCNFDENRSEAVQKRFHRNYARSRRRFENVQEGNEQVKDMPCNFDGARNRRLTAADIQTPNAYIQAPKMLT